MKALRFSLLSIVLSVSAIGCKKQEANDSATATESSKTEAKKPEKLTPAAVKAPADVANAPKDAKSLSEGVSYIVVTPPPNEKSEIVGPNDLVTLHFDVWTRDGKTLQSTHTRGKPVKYALGSIPMRNLAAAATGMAIGEKRRVWVSDQKAYNPNPTQPAKALTYDIEIVGLQAGPAVPKGLTGKGSQKGKNGVSYEVVTKPSGKKSPKTSDQVKLLMEEWNTDGRLYRSPSFRGGKSTTMTVSQLNPGLASILVAMKTGERRKIWVPASQGYGGGRNMPTGDLYYDITLQDVIEKAPPPPVPKDVAAAPKSAKKTEKGVSYRVLKKGTGKESPKPTDDVKVHYSGWTTDGKMFDSSVTRGQPATFNLGGVIPGWTDGLQTMKVGGKTRFWIPGKMAYEGRRGPQGTLVFDVELLEIVK